MLVSPLPADASRLKWGPEKKTYFVGLFFSYGCRPMLPLGWYLPWNSTYRSLLYYSTVFAQQAMARILCTGVAPCHHLHSEALPECEFCRWPSVITCKTRHGQIFGVCPWYRMPNPLIHLDPLILWYCMKSTVAKKIVLYSKLLA